VTHRNQPPAASPSYGLAVPADRSDRSEKPRRLGSVPKPVSSLKLSIEEVASVKRVARSLVGPILRVNDAATSEEPGDPGDRGSELARIPMGRPKSLTARRQAREPPSWVVDAEKFHLRTSTATRSGFDSEDSPGPRKRASHVYRRAGRVAGDSLKTSLRPEPLGGSAHLPGMAAAVKDGTIKHVMSWVNPQGCRSSRSSRHRPKISTTTICGGALQRSPP